MFPLAAARRHKPLFSTLTLAALRPCALALCAAIAFAASTVQAAYLIVLNSDDDSLSLIDPHTNTEVSRLPIGRGPHHMMALPDDSALLIGLTGMNQLLLVDRKTGAVTRRIPALDPYQLGFSPDGKYFVTTALRQDFVDIYPGKLGDELKPLARVKTGVQPSHMAFRTTAALSTSPSRAAARWRKSSSPPARW